MKKEKEPKVEEVVAEESLPVEPKTHHEAECHETLKLVKEHLVKFHELAMKKVCVEPDEYVRLIELSEKALKS